MQGGGGGSMIIINQLLSHAILIFSLKSHKLWAFDSELAHQMVIREENFYIGDILINETKKTFYLIICVAFRYFDINNI